jgi:hypothetical protein
MLKTLKPDYRILLRPHSVIAMALLVGLSGQASARSTEPLFAMVTQAAFEGSLASTPGQSVLTSRGPAYVTGNFGSMETTTLPGSGGQGLLMNNGNGTSTLIMPGGLPQTVATPR